MNDRNMAQTNSTEVQIAIIIEGVKNIESKVTSIDLRLRSDYVTNDKLQLTIEKVLRLEKLIYGSIGIMLTSIVLAIMSLIIRKP